VKKALVLTCLLAPLAAAAGDNTSAAHAACMEKSGGVTSAMQDCIATELLRQDARLNKAYKAAMAPLTASRKKQLLSAQRAWLAFRDANCQFRHVTCPSSRAWPSWRTRGRRRWLGRPWPPASASSRQSRRRCGPSSRGCWRTDLAWPSHRPLCVSAGNGVSRVWLYHSRVNPSMFNRFHNPQISRPVVAMNAVNVVNLLAGLQMLNESICN